MLPCPFLMIPIVTEQEYVKKKKNQNCHKENKKDMKDLW